jgi:hypothetical protein
MAKQLLGEFKLQRLGSFPIMSPADRNILDDEAEEFFEMMQDAEESRALSTKKMRTRVKPNWEH